MKAGTKLKSLVCDTEVMVIKTDADSVFECGGAAMDVERPADKGAVNPAFAEGTKMGKRYTDANATVELLCIRQGAGSLALGGVALVLKDVKPLPASD